MVAGRVLVIDGDESSGIVVREALEASGFSAELSGSAQAGFRKACEERWDCIVCSPELPDIDGVWVARRVRTEPGPIAKVPILFFGELADKSMRAQALGVGVDVFLARPPATLEDLTAQVAALISMARRYDNEEAEPASVSNTAAIRGDLSAFPLASLLMMFEMERRSGTVHVVAANGKRCELVFSDGLFATTESGGVPRPPLDVLREVLSWRSGRFSFSPQESENLPAPRASVGALVLEAMRLEDEQMGEMPELSPDDVTLLPSLRGIAIAEAGSDETSARARSDFEIDVEIDLHEEKVQIREDTEHRTLPPAPPKAKSAE